MMWPFFRRSEKTVAPDLEVEIHRDVAGALLEEIDGLPDVEVGGKLIGYVDDPGAGSPPDAPERLEGLRIRVVGYLDAGPHVRRTPTYHLPDGPYQEELFRELEAIDPELEHLGSWHSHHPNGMRSLSGGDIECYRRDVNDPRYHPDVFLATLVVDETGLDHALHHLFVRGASRYLELASSAVRLFDGFNPWTVRIAEARGRVLERRTRASRPAARAWYETPEGKASLLGDRAWISDVARNPTARLDRRTSRISWSGDRTCRGRALVVSLTRGGPGADQVVLRVRDPKSELTLEVPASACHDRDAVLREALERVADFGAAFEMVLVGRETSMA